MLWITSTASFERQDEVNVESFVNQIVLVFDKMNLSDARMIVNANVILLCLLVRYGNQTVDRATYLGVRSNRCKQLEGEEDREQSW